MADPEAPHRDVMRRRPLPQRSQKVLHVLLNVFGWSLFVWFWWHVVTAQEVDARDIALLFIASVVVLPAVTVTWIMHNRNLYRRKGPRTTVRQVRAAYDQDWAGRPVHADWDALKQARVVTISIDQLGKHFRAQ